VPASVDLFFFLFPLVMQPVLLMEEKLTAHMAFENMVLVRFPLVHYEIVIAGELLMAVLACGLFAMQKAHGSG